MCDMLSQMASIVDSLKGNDSMQKHCYSSNFGEPAGVVSFDSGVRIDGSSDIEHVPEEKETELDLSRILCDLSPIPPVGSHFEARRHEEIQVCDAQHGDDESHEGSDNESLAIPSSGEDDEENKQNGDGEANKVCVDLPSPPFLEAPSSCNVQFDGSQGGLNPAVTYPPFTFIPSNCPYYGSRVPVDCPIRPSTGDTTRMFSSTSSNASTTQDPQDIRHDGGTSAIQREPSNDERIDFLKECSSAALWQFVLDCLSHPARFNNVCLWTRNVWEFCIMQTKKFAERWDEYNCNRVTTSYVKVARALKSYENTQFCGLTLLGRVSSRRNTFRFLPDHNSPLIPQIHYEPPISEQSAGCLTPQQRPFASARTPFGSVDSSGSELTRNNCYATFELATQPRAVAKRSLELHPDEAQLEASRLIKNPRIDRSYLQFPPQMQNITASTPLRDASAPMMFGREVTNAYRLGQQQPSFAQSSFVPAACSSNQWINQNPVYQSNTSFWGCPNGSLSCQFPDNNMQGYTCGGLNERTSFGYATPTSSICTNENNFDCNNFMNASNDSAFYEDMASARSYSHATHCTPLASSINREDISPENARTGCLYGDANVYR